MRRKIPFYAYLAIIPVVGFALIASSGGRNEGRTGSPLDGTAQGNTCAQCHTGTYNPNNANLVISAPATYTPGQTYNITVDGSAVVQSTRNGFQITAENTTAKQGTWIAGPGSRLTTSGEALTQSAADTDGIWDFQWTAPSTDQGAITFYAVLNASNGNFSSGAGDNVYTNFSQAVLSTEDELLARFQMYPNPTVDAIYIDLPEGISGAEVAVYSISGALVTSGDISNRNNRIDVSGLSSGTYFANVSADGARSAKAFIKR